MDIDDGGWMDGSWSLAYTLTHTHTLIIMLNLLSCLCANGTWLSGELAKRASKLNFHTHCSRVRVSQQRKNESTFGDGIHLKIATWKEAEEEE